MSERQIFAGCAWQPIPLMAAGYPGDFIDSLNVGFALTEGRAQNGCSKGVPLAGNSVRKFQNDTFSATLQEEMAWQWL